ncbi:MAG: hypothetical protein N3G22_01565 [Candidatus Micrarchaeota archaeon]|nr:hypothetical protein [Candidatus Micrarchaeota archaeon]
MPMKKDCMREAAFFLVLLGLSFSAAPFPEKLERAGLYLANESVEGVLGNGSAVYLSSDNMTEVSIQAEPISSEDWKDIAAEHEKVDGKGITGKGLEFYYYCVFWEANSVCGFETYADGSYYQISVRKDGASEEELVKIGQRVMYELLPGGGLNICPFAIIVLLFPPAFALARKLGS